MEISKFGLKNFRIFRDHYDFDLAPIMLLTGPNNAGKSSLTKALLLMKENSLNSGKYISKEGFRERILNYYKGAHDLGSHKLILSDEEESTIFSFSTFKNFKFQIEINNSRVYEWDYIIANKENEIVLAQKRDRIYIETENFKNYVFHWTENYRKTNPLITEESRALLTKVAKSLANYIMYASNNKIRLIDIVMWDLFEFSQKQFEEDLKSGILTTLPHNFNTDKNPENLDFQEVLILLFKKITSIEFTREEITALIPPSDLYNSSSNFFHFPKLIYVNSLKEPLKRSYSLNDSSIFQSFIINEMNFRRPDIFDTPQNQYCIDDKNSLESKLVNRELYIKFIKKWLAEFEIGERLCYGYDQDHDTYFIKIDNRSLPDYGFGYSSILHILLALSNEAIEQNEKNTKNNELENLKLKFPPTYIIEEPETGLHPAFQSKMAEMLVDIQKTFNVHLIIETHSEYIIRKLQFLTATKKLNIGEVVIYYFNNPKKIPKGEEQIKKITIEKGGNLTDNFGPGFIDEATNLKFELLRLNKNQNN